MQEQDGLVLMARYCINLPGWHVPHSTRLERWWEQQARELIGPASMVLCMRPPRSLASEIGADRKNGWAPSPSPSVSAHHRLVGPAVAKGILYRLLSSYIPAVTRLPTVMHPRPVSRGMPLGPSTSSPPRKSGARFMQPSCQNKSFMQATWTANRRPGATDLCLGYR